MPPKSSSADSAVADSPRTPMTRLQTKFSATSFNGQSPKRKSPMEDDSELKVTSFPNYAAAPSADER